VHRVGDKKSYTMMHGQPIIKFNRWNLYALNNKTMSGSIFCDREKAFNAVNHDLLPSKLPYYGISGKAKLLFESYIQNRYQSSNHYLVS
jgi:hypothetical protein